MWLQEPSGVPVFPRSFRPLCPCPSMPRGPAVRSDERKMLTGARRGRLSRAGISGCLTLPDPAVPQAEMFIPSGLPPSRLLASHPVLFGSDGCPSLAPGDMQNPPRPFFPGRGERGFQNGCRATLGGGLGPQSQRFRLLFFHVSMASCSRRVLGGFRVSSVPCHCCFR